MKRKFKKTLRGIFPNAIDQIQRLIGVEDKTYAGEFTHLRHLLNCLGGPKGFAFIDIGAGDGFNMSVAWPLMNQYQAYGLLIEPNSSQLNKARRLYRKNSNFEFSDEFLTPINVCDVIARHGFNQSLYIKIDIDSYDLEIMKALVLHDLKPKIFSIEINEIFPPPVIFEWKYSKKQEFPKPPFHGCSLQSVFNFASENGYLLHSLAFNNAFFVLADFAKEQNAFNPLAPQDAYLEGFFYRNWQELFPWDIDFEEWLTMPAHKIVSVARGHPHFNPELSVLSEN